MEEYILDYNAKDIGEIIEIIRIQHIKLHAEPFAQKIGVSEKALLTAEEGKGPHGMLILRKINETFPSLSVSLSVQLF
jgi:DNA-binding XRE family transcriptional regulator